MAHGVRRFNTCHRYTLGGSTGFWLRTHAAMTLISWSESCGLGMGTPPVGGNLYLPSINID